MAGSTQTMLKKMRSSKTNESLSSTPGIESNVEDERPKLTLSPGANLDMENALTHMLGAFAAKENSPMS